MTDKHHAPARNAHPTMSLALASVAWATAVIMTCARPSSAGPPSPPSSAPNAFDSLRVVYGVSGFYVGQDILEISGRNHRYEMDRTSSLRRLHLANIYSDDKRQYAAVDLLANSAMVIPASHPRWDDPAVRTQPHANAVHGTHLGQDCVITVTPDVEVWMWGDVILKLVQRTRAGDITVEATSIDFHPTIRLDAFEVPHSAKVSRPVQPAAANPDDLGGGR